jgi:hypothetical protein
MPNPPAFDNMVHMTLTRLASKTLIVLILGAARAPFAAAQPASPADTSPRAESGIDLEGIDRSVARATTSSSTPTARG